MRISMLTAALFTRAKIWKQTKCPPGEWIKKTWDLCVCTHTQVLLSHIEDAISHLQQHGWT